MDAMKPFSEAAADPYDYARRWKKAHGGPVIGSFCTYAPEEIVWAAGGLPLRLFGASGMLTLADGHLQAYSCSLVRGAMEEALAGRLAFLDGVVFPHTCDSIQRLSDLWRLNVATGFHVDVVLPVKLTTASARDYLVEVIGRFRRDLENHVGRPITDEALAGAIADYNRLRAGLERLYRLKMDHPGAITAAAVQTVVRAATVMDRAEMAGHLEALLAVLEAGASTAGPTGGPRLVLSGGACSLPDIHQAVEGAGAAVVWDDLCTGTRSFTGAIATGPDPIGAIARRYAERVVCPAKHAGLDSRAKALIDAVKKSRADGVVFVVLKFCDPHLFDYPYLKSYLDERGIPSLMLEIEDRQAGTGQFATRIEAFVETINNRP